MASCVKAIDASSPVTRKEAPDLDSRGPRQGPVTRLEANPFAVLGASVRDERRRLVELTDRGALMGDEVACRSALTTLSNPRTRLAAEVSWLPRVAPARSETLLTTVKDAPASVRDVAGLPSLAVSNLLAAAIERLDIEQTADEWTRWIVALARASHAIDASEVMRDINEDRSISGIPPVSGQQLVEEALADQRRYHRGTIIDAMKRMKSRTLLDAFTRAVQDTTTNGRDPAPPLVEELGAEYELQASAALSKGADGLVKVIDATRQAAPLGRDAVDRHLSVIETLARRWDVLAQPIQLLHMTRGLTHQASSRLAYAIRSLAVDLVNDHGMIDEGARLTHLLAEVFAELPDVVERLDQDAEALEGLSEQREAAKDNEAEWAKAITFSAEIGAVFKNTLAISPDGVSWKGKHFGLEDITRIRWGATRHSVNGIPTGTTYTVAFGDKGRQAECETRQEQVWSEFVDRLWRTAGVRITTEFLARLRAGETVRFGEAVVDDHGVTMPRHAIFGGSEPVRGGWHEVSFVSANGSFVISLIRDKKVYADLPYLSTDNVHCLEMAITRLFKSPKRRLSDVFSG